MRFWLLKQVARLMGLKVQITMSDRAEGLTLVLLSRRHTDAALMLHTLNGARWADELDIPEHVH